MNENGQQRLALIVFLVGAGAFFYLGGEMLKHHTAWADFQAPAGVGEVFGIFASVIGAVAAALKLDVTMIQKLWTKHD